MQPTQFRLRDNTYNTSLISENYAYFDDGRLSSVADLDDTGGSNPPATLRFLSRSYAYDTVGRVASSTSSNTEPFNQSYGYDAFGNLTSRSGTYYFQASQSDTGSYANNRRNGWSYDADGRISYTPPTTNDGTRNLWYDGAGQLVNNTNVSGSTSTNYTPAYDGDGQLAYERAQTTVNGSSASITTSYIMRSTVLRGEILTRLDQNGNKSSTYVPAEGLLFATQSMVGGASVTWTQRNPLGITETGLGVYDPLGNYVPFQHQQDPRPPAGSYNSSSMSGLAASLGNTSDYGGMGCLMDGLPTSCSRLLRTIQSGLGDKLILSGASRAGLLRLGIVITDGPLENDKRLWGIWVVIPGSQPTTTQNPQSTPTPCDVQIPDDERSKILIGVALTETTVTRYNNGVFSFDQYAKGKGDATVLHKEGDAAVQELNSEIFYMASALINQVAEGHYAGSLEDAARGESLGYATWGQSRNAQLNASPEYCLKARLVLANLNYIDHHGTARDENGNPIRYWRGVNQSGDIRLFRKGDIRAGNSDFMYLPPQINGKNNPVYFKLPYWINGHWSW